MDTEFVMFCRKEHFLWIGLKRKYCTFFQFSRKFEIVYTCPFSQTFCIVLQQMFLDIIWIFKFSRKYFKFSFFSYIFLIDFREETFRVNPTYAASRTAGWSWSPSTNECWSQCCSSDFSLAMHRLFTLWILLPQQDVRSLLGPFFPATDSECEKFTFMLLHAKAKNFV
jgi:hypothetical protein